MPTQRGGGIASYVKELATAMAARGHKVTIICASDDTRMQSDQMVEGVRIMRLKGGDFIIPSVEHTPFVLFKKLRMLYRFHSYRKSILATLNTLEDVDIIEVPDFGAEAYYLWHQDKPVVIRMHTPSSFILTTTGAKHHPISKFYLSWGDKKEIDTLTHFTHFSACSHSIQKWYQQHFPQVRGEWQTIYNPLDTTRWNSDKSANSYSPYSVFYAGTVMQAKGVAELIKACALLREEGLPIELTIAGKMGNYGLTLKENTQSRGYSWCRFTGNLPREELVSLYKSAKVACFPSHWENLPLVCLEAMAIGNIVIGSLSGGMAEIITDGEDGWLVKPKDVLALKNTIKKALNMDDAAVKTMRTKARQTVEDRFSAEHIIPLMEQYYAHLCHANLD